MSISMREAIRLAIRDEMRCDGRVIVFGEDVANAGGVFKVTAGLLEEFGASRVRDTPISETAIIGSAIGAAAAGLRPIAEIMFDEHARSGRGVTVEREDRVRAHACGDT